jgi:hypothetical protein
VWPLRRLFRFRFVRGGAEARAAARFPRNVSAAFLRQQQLGQLGQRWRWRWRRRREGERKQWGVVGRRLLGRGSVGSWRLVGDGRVGAVCDDGRDAGQARRPRTLPRRGGPLTLRQGPLYPVGVLALGRGRAV